MNTGRLGGLIAFATVLVSSAASAAEPAPGWEPGFTFVPYGWLAGFKGEIGTSGGDIDPGGGFELPERVDVSVDDELTEIGFMFYGEWRGERWFAFFDSVWANVSQDGVLSLPNLLPSTEAYAGIDGNIYELALGYRLFTLQSSTLSLYGGARYYDIDAEARFEGGLLPQGVTVSSQESWTDGVIGARWGIRFNDKWHGLVLADLGFGESDTSWQLFATVAYRFNDWGSAVVGYRYLSLDYETPDYRADLDLYGPAVGLAIRF
jgi:hypothetical protein